MELCVGMRVMLTDNVSVSGRLTNGSTGRVQHLDMRSKPLSSRIYVKFHDSRAGNSLKDGRLCGELKECVPVTARVKRFSFKESQKYCCC